MASLLAFQKEPLAFQVDIGKSAFAADSFQVDAFQILWDGAFQIDGDLPPVDPPAPPQPSGGGGGGPFVGGIFRLGTERYVDPRRDLTREWMDRERQEREAKRLALLLQAKREDEEVATLFAALAHIGFFGRLQ